MLEECRIENTIQAGAELFQHALYAIMKARGAAGCAQTTIPEKASPSDKFIVASPEPQKQHVLTGIRKNRDTGRIGQEGAVDLEHGLPQRNLHGSRLMLATQSLDAMPQGCPLESILGHPMKIRSRWCGHLFPFRA